MRSCEQGRYFVAREIGEKLLDEDVWLRKKLTIDGTGHRVGWRLGCSTVDGRGLWCQGSASENRRKVQCGQDLSDRYRIGNEKIKSALFVLVLSLVFDESHLGWLLQGRKS